MIVNIEQYDGNENGYPVKSLRVSYINKEGELSILSVNVPPNELYKWDYAKGSEIPDKTFRSWDDRPVVKVPLKAREDLPATRVQEILYSQSKIYPEHYKDLFELNLPRIAYLDIETMVGDDGFPLPEEAKNRVNTIAWVENDIVTVLGLATLTDKQIANIQRRIDEHCKKFTTKYKFVYRYFDKEWDMLAILMRDYVCSVPALTGWNVVRFDMLYLFNRCRRLGIEIDGISPTRSWYNYSLMKLYNKKDKAEKVSLPRHRLIFDYMEVYQKWDTSIYPHSSLKLDDVGEEAVGVKKVQHKMGFNEMWEKAPEDYVFYNAVDSILVREIDLKLKTAAIFFALTNLIHCEAHIAFSPVQSLQIFQTEYIYNEHKVFPTIKRDDKEKEPYEGAFVFDPIPGAYKNVVALDFASLYPTTMRQFNISPDTFICKDKNRPRNPDEIKCKSGAVYKRDVEGILPMILRDVYNKRKEYKAEMKIAIQEMYDLEEIIEKRMKGATS